MMGPGGTVGDIESLPFLEAIRQFRKDVGRNNVVYMHVTLIPWIPAAKEMKTKPTQHSVKELRSIGIQPDVLVCRCHLPLQPGLKEKLSAFCDVPVESVITAQDASSIYEVPLNLEKEGLAQQTLELLNLGVLWYQVVLVLGVWMAKLRRSSMLGSIIFLSWVSV